MACYDFVLHQIILTANTANTLALFLCYMSISGLISLFNSQLQWHLFSLFPFDLSTSNPSHSLSIPIEHGLISGTMQFIFLISSWPVCIKCIVFCFQSIQSILFSFTS